METHVPIEMMMEGWTAAHPQTLANWSVERDVFTWLSFGTSIEKVIDMYEGWLTKRKATTLNEKVKARWLAWQYGRCHHHVNTWLRACPVCDEQHTACIEFLKGLKARVSKYEQAQERHTSNQKDETKVYRVRSSKYYRILGVVEGISAEEIKRRYRELVRMWHPDQYRSEPSRQKLCEQKMKEINEAYEFFKQRGNL